MLVNFAGHEDVITSIKFGKTDPNLLLSSSLDGTIRYASLFMPDDDCNV